MTSPTLFPTNLLTALAVAAGLVLAGCVAAQDAAAPAQTAGISAEDELLATNPVSDFLAKLEEKNRDLETLYGRFHQVRVNMMFSEEIQSNGEFWYRKPNAFRCDYADPSPAQFFLLDNKMFFYSKENKQLEVTTFPEGRDLPINQMLVGFGLSVEKIFEVFHVTAPADQPEDPNLYALQFVSRDPERSLGFERIVITFDREKLEPRILYMEEESEDTVTMEITEIRTNPAIEEGHFDASFPSDVTVREF